MRAGLLAAGVMVVVRSAAAPVVHVAVAVPKVPLQVQLLQRRLTT
jgi:hypothetical protein